MTTNTGEPIPAAEAEAVLHALGWSGRLGRDEVELGSLRDLLVECPCNAVFDWRGSVDEAIETIEAIVPDLPRGWARRSKSVRSVQEAAKQAAPDILWLPWGHNDQSDTEEFLLVRAKVWREIERPWLRQVLEGVETAAPEPEGPDRGEQVAEVAHRLLRDLREEDALEIEGGDEQAARLEAALAAQLRTLNPGNPVLGDLLGDWLLRRPEVGDLFLGDEELGARAATLWKQVLGQLEEFPVEGRPGQTLTIRGPRLAGAQWVRLGAHECAIVAGPHLSVLLPEHVKPGRYRFMVCRRDGRIVTSPNEFTVRPRTPADV